MPVGRGDRRLHSCNGRRIVPEPVAAYTAFRAASELLLLVLSRPWPEAWAIPYWLHVSFRRRKLRVELLGAWNEWQSPFDEEPSFYPVGKSTSMLTVIRPAAVSDAARYLIGHVPIHGFDMPKQPEVIELPGDVSPESVAHVAESGWRMLIAAMTGCFHQLDLYHAEPGKPARWHGTLTKATKRGEISHPRSVALLDGSAIVWRRFNGKHSNDEVDAALWYLPIGDLSAPVLTPARLSAEKQVPTESWNVFRGRGRTLIEWKNGRHSTDPQHCAVVRKLGDFSKAVLSLSVEQRIERIVEMKAGIFAICAECSDDPDFWALSWHSIEP